MESKTYEVKDVEAMLNISRNTAYKFIKKVYAEQKPFTVFNVGGSYRIPKKSFDRWIDGDG